MNAPTAADALCRALTAQGVEIIFGHPGGAILPFYDALYRAAAPRHVLARHEQGAAHAADGYARATGRVGVCAATSGPGATNLVTGLATAMMDGVPIVAITGQVPTAVQGQDAFQETDIIGVTMPVTKHGYLIEDPEDVPGVVAEAFELAVSGRPGPVVIDIPKDVQNKPCGAPIPTGPASANGGRGGPAPAIDAEALEAAARLVNEAERPLVMAGRGVVISGTDGALRALAERGHLPVVTTLLGLDAFPATHPLALGLPGMHGTIRANRGIQEADVILGLGLRFDDRVTGAVDRFAPNAEIVHIDIDPASLGRTVRPAIAMLADLRDLLPELATRIAPRRHPEWWTRLEEWPRDAEPREDWVEPAGPLGGRTAARALANRIAARGAIAVTDVGQHQMWMAQELRDAAPGTHLTSGGLGTMGYALPAGMGAALGRPDRPTWVIAGDGGFQMTMQELATVVQERIPLRIAVFNNGFLGMVRQWQEIFYERRYAETALINPNLSMIAAAYGIPARAVERAEDLDDALAWADAAAGPVLLDLMVLQEENVFPMVPSGAALHELVTALKSGATT